MASNNLETIYYYNLPLIVSKSLTYTGIGSNTKTTTQQLMNETFQVLLDFRVKN